MRQTTEQHMINAFGGESMANMRYRHFAVQAEKDNFPNVARLLTAVANAETSTRATTTGRSATWRAALWPTAWAPSDLGLPPRTWAWP
jgi:hypothetical protein